MRIEIEGDALKLLEDFLKYARMYPEEMSSVMMYDLDAFNRRRNLLQKSVENRI